MNRRLNRDNTDFLKGEIYELKATVKRIGPIQNKSLEFSVEFAFENNYSVNCWCLLRTARGRVLSAQQVKPKLDFPFFHERDLFDKSENFMPLIEFVYSKFNLQDKTSSNLADMKIDNRHGSIFTFSHNNPFDKLYTSTKDSQINFKIDKVENNYSDLFYSDSADEKNHERGGSTGFIVPSDSDDLGKEPSHSLFGEEPSDLGNDLKQRNDYAANANVGNQKTKSNDGEDETGWQRLQKFPEPDNKAVIKKLEADKKQLADENNRQKVILDDLNTKLASLEKDFAALKLTKPSGAVAETNMNTALKAKEEELVKVRNSFIKKAQECETLTSEINSLKKQLINLQKESQQPVANTEEFKQQWESELQSERNELDNTKKVIEEKLEALQKKEAAFNEQFEAYLLDKDQHDYDVNALAEKTQTDEQRLKDLKEAIDDDRRKLENAKRKYNTEMKKLGQFRQELKSAHEQLEKDRAALKALNKIKNLEEIAANAKRLQSQVDPFLKALEKFALTESIYAVETEVDADTGSYKAILNIVEWYQRNQVFLEQDLKKSPLINQMGDKASHYARYWKALREQLEQLLNDMALQMKNPDISEAEMQKFVLTKFDGESGAKAIMALDDYFRGLMQLVIPAIGNCGKERAKDSDMESALKWVRQQLWHFNGYITAYLQYNKIQKRG